MTSQYELDSQEISRIQFHTPFSSELKNEMIAKIEAKMAIEEQKELDGNGTGYYTDEDAN